MPGARQRSEVVENRYQKLMPGLDCAFELQANSVRWQAASVAQVLAHVLASHRSRLHRGTIEAPRKSQRA